MLSINDINNPVEVAYFDTYTSGDKLDFVGSWSNYPFFESGTIPVSSIEEGLFLLKASEGGSLSTKRDQIPENFELKQNYPNPFNPNTKISFSINNRTIVSLNIYDINGRLIQNIYHAKTPAGYYHFIWNADNLSSGIYFLSLEYDKKIKKLWDNPYRYDATHGL